MKAHKVVVPAVLLAALVVAGCGSSSSGGAISVAAQPPSSPQQIEAVESNLRNLATAEESYLTDYILYTADSAGMVGEGFTRAPETEDETLVAGVDGDMSYCLIGSPSAGDVWILYDSANGGIQDSTYTSESDAEAACTDPKITDYRAIAGVVTTPTDDNTPAAPANVPVDDTEANLRNLAVSEETYLVDFNRYTASSAGLAREGFQHFAGTEGETLLAGVDGNIGYCLIGGATTAGPWILYDSRHGGILAMTYASQSDAEAACIDPKITDYQPV